MDNNNNINFDLSEWYNYTVDLSYNDPKYIEVKIYLTNLKLLE